MMGVIAESVPNPTLRELLDVVETLKKRGIALLSLEEKIDTSSAAGELVFHVFGAIARDGMNVARAKGRHPGRPPLDREKLDAAMLLMKGGMPPTKSGPPNRARAINPVSGDSSERQRLTP